MAYVAVFTQSVGISVQLIYCPAVLAQISRLQSSLLAYLLSSVYVKDEVIRKRLLIDGDGAGDDRRINLLLKSFTKWCNSPGTPEEGSVSAE